MGHAVVVQGADGCHRQARGKAGGQGKKIDFKELLRMEPDSGTTNIRNTSSKHWKRWLGV